MDSRVVGIVAIFGIAAMMLKMWLSHVERIKAISMSQKGPSLSDQRMERVEQAIEAIAVEVERVSEGQRFVTKLLSQQGVTATPPAPVPGSISRRQ